MRPALTQRQRQALQFITDCLSDRGYPPTLREIGEHMGIRSTNGVNDHLKALERKGYLVREELKSRALRPVELETSARVSSESTDQRRGDEMEIAILGRVAAGEPILAEENVIDRVVVDRYFLGAVKAKEVFGLVVRGESMIDAGIFDGDYIFVRKQSTASEGEIVVVMIEGEATCKRFYHEGDRIRLEPANSSMNPIYVRRDEFRAIEVLGKVVGVYRRLH
ncbi:transcriptional repressor LexA [Paraliomyxa miuraensis]|uniref:transcriptional repressor LexA n=1 Tax=Paraliomyxa miuraensis TaxID=376150 RepID=UPI002259CAEE|nr:transcriptional repressor LexA [Paraliomyxa miuraensis]MCX4245538.1 transcriptional repressor LexA [Paraliomyxa miuraensis]